MVTKECGEQGRGLQKIEAVEKEKMQLNDRIGLGEIKNGSAQTQRRNVVVGEKGKVRIRRARRG